MRSFDQYGNIALENCFERIFVEKQYCEIEKGVIVIRGDNLALLGEVDVRKEKEISNTVWKKVQGNELLELYKQEKENQQLEDNHRKKILLESGLGGDWDTMDQI